MGVRELLSSAVALFQPRSRRAWCSETRAHIEFPVLGREELARFSEAIERRTAGLEHLEWVEVNAHTQRVVFAFAKLAYGLDELEELVADAERAARVSGARFSERSADHPADEEPATQLLVEMLADLGGLGLATVVTLSPLKPFMVGSTAAALLSVTRSAPRLRRGLDERFGQGRTDLGLSLASAFANGLAQRKGTQLVELGAKLSSLREVRARQRAWVRREPELTERPSAPNPEAARVDPRPLPLPRGPIEEYADRAWFVSLGGFALSFITTRSVQRAVAALFGGLPKPARLGREAFSAELSRALSGRGLVILDPGAIRRLDRVDCLVIQGDLLAKDKFTLGRVRVTEIDLATARQQVLALFDPEAPVRVRRDGEWRLGPPQRLGAQAPSDLEQAAAEWAADGGLVLALARGGSVVAVAELEVVPQTGVEELISAAHAAEMRVVLTHEQEDVLDGLHVDDVITPAEGVLGGVRRLQREGRVVCLVGTGTCSGLPVADVAIGLCREGEPTPWGAHIICREDLSDVRFLIEACPVARSVSKQSVNVALGAATLGALVSAGGLLPLTTRRVLFVVNTATMISMVNGLRGSFALERRALPPPRDPTPWHALTAAGTLARLGSSAGGLGLRQIAIRRRPEVEERPAALELVEAVTDELFNPLAPLLAAGAGLSAVVGSTADAVMVGGVVVLNAVVGGVQKFRTERTIRRLATATTRLALVRRGGGARYVNASELVRGDIVLLSAGDVVPADCRLIDAESLEVDASSLTGESLPVAKSAAPSFDSSVADRRSMLYAETSIAAGRATAVVVAVGDETEARRGSAARNDRLGGVEQRLRSLMSLTGPVALAAGAGVVGAGLLRGRKLSALVDSGVSLAVGAVPEGLPLLATAAQLAAAKRLSQRGALVRNVRSVEALGRVDVLCLDKTGTVTEGRVALTGVSDGQTFEDLTALSGARAGALAGGLRATPERPKHGARPDPLDQALTGAARSLGIARDYASDGWRRMSELSFEAGRGYHAVLAHDERGVLLSVKGAPEVLLAACTRRAGEPMDDRARQQLADEAARLAKRGLRVIAVAERRAAVEDNVDPARLVGLSFRGLLAFADPVRATARAAVEDLKAAGVRTLMITGDHPSTAEAIGKELGLLTEQGTLTGAELAALSDEELDRRLDDLTLFARVTPSQKVRIVRALQRKGRVVAMAGDGANDAPAIRLADVGIAIGEASATAARRAADVVVTDERVETLVHAIVEGRATWRAVREAVAILVGGNLGEIGFTLGAGLVDGRPPLNARQLLLVNLFTDVVPAMVIALRPPSTDTMAQLATEGPEASLGAKLNGEIGSRAAVTALGAGSAWLVGRLTGTSARARTIGLAALVGTQLGQTMRVGGYTAPVMAASVGSGLLLAAIIQTPFVSQFFGCRPMGPIGWATALGASVAATSASSALPRYVGDLGEKLQRWSLRARPEADSVWLDVADALPEAEG
ncbi:MAG: HAD-IC family P-type ATPase [Polyangiaceae bacterium]|nr:HAD-IC family P-type ATPase [Polyangiaceae bacterium]MCW5789764.1 HAD-IC family P-type ATPase [Polyangiaceae bacterium]